MTYKAFLFEGAAAGTSATAANTGAAVINKGGGTSTLTAAAAAHGSCGIEFVTTATGQYDIGRFLTDATNARMAFSGVFSYVGGGTANASTADTTIGGIRQSSSDALAVRFQVDATDKFRVLDFGSAAISAANLKYQLTPGTKYRIEVVADQGVGSATANLYTPTGTTPLATWASTTANLGTSVLTGGEVGCISANQAMTIRWDDLLFNDGGTAQLGVYDPASTPLSGTGTLTPTAGESPLTVAVVLTGTGGTGTGRQYSVTWGDGTSTGPQTSASFSHTYSTAGSYQPSGLITEPA